METKPAPIGFEGLFSGNPDIYIGFERFEKDQQTTTTTLVYPTDDTMPTPIHSPRCNSSHADHTSSTPSPRIRPSLEHDTLARRTSQRILSDTQLSLIYDEIVHQWSTVQWLQFADHHSKTHLTLYCDTAETTSVQLAINQYQRTSAGTSLLALPECLLIRTKSTTQALFLPNAILSIDNLCEQGMDEGLSQYRLLAIICHSNETNSKTMFYKDFQSDAWYVCYDRSTSPPPHSNRLSDDEKSELELFVQPGDEINQLESSAWGSPLSDLFNHPIVYVYLKKENEAD